MSRTNKASSNLAFNSNPISFNHVITTGYNDGSDKITFHKDKMNDIEADTPIVSLSFGATRMFTLGKKEANKKEIKTVHTIPLAQGDLFCLGPETNKQLYHAVPPTDEAVAPRISLVFRDIKGTHQAL